MNVKDVMTSHVSQHRVLEAASWWFDRRLGDFHVSAGDGI